MAHDRSRAERAPEGEDRSESLLVGPEQADERLDRFLAARLPGPSRSQIKRAIDQGLALVDGKPARAGQKLRPGQLVRFELLPPEPSTVEPEDLALDIVLEDELVVVVNKPPGMVVHPAAGNYRGTLVAGLLARGGLEGGEPTRPGIVHRLDKDTSGLLVVARTVEAHERLARQFREHTVGRRYLALVRGVPRADKGVFRTSYGRDPRHRVRFSSRYPASRLAVTHFEVLERFGRVAALVACTLETGRTHQVRVHMADHGSPVLGDALYGGSGAGGSRVLQAALREIGRQALHAERLAFDHPGTGERVELEVAPPADFLAALEALRGER